MCNASIVRMFSRGHFLVREGSKVVYTWRNTCIQGGAMPENNDTCRESVLNDVSFFSVFNGINRSVLIDIHRST